MRRCFLLQNYYTRHISSRKDKQNRESAQYRSPTETVGDGGLNEETKEIANFVGEDEEAGKVGEHCQRRRREIAGRYWQAGMLSGYTGQLGGIVLGTILRYDFTREQLLTVGIAVVIVFFIGGILLGAKKKNGDNGNQTEKKW